MTGGPDLRLDELRRLAEGEDLTAFVRRAALLHPSDLADVLAALDQATRVRAVAELPPEIASSALAEMEATEHPEEILRAVGPGYAAELVEELPTDDAADIVRELPPDERAAVLAEVEDRADVERLLAYPEDSAGGLMTTEVVAVDQDATLAEAIAEIRLQSGEGDEPYQVYAVDRDRRLRGTIPIARLVVSPPDRRVRDVMTPAPAMVRPEQDQEQVARLMARYNLAAVPVVDHDDRLLGRITFDDVIDVVEAEQTEDLLLLAGVSEEEALRGTWRDAVQARLPWLAVNMVTAFMGVSVILIFGEIIESIWFIAAVMPIIAGMGGNSGTQSLAVTVRHIAISRGSLEGPSDAVRKEAIVGLVNGFALGVLAFGVAWIAAMLIPAVSHRLPWVILLALWGNIVIGASMGALIPTLLHRMGADPAIASSVFLTTFTDMMGFLLLLGLASALLL